MRSIVLYNSKLLSRVLHLTPCYSARREGSGFKTLKLPRLKHINCSEESKEQNEQVLFKVDNKADAWIQELLKAAELRAAVNNYRQFKKVDQKS